MSNNQPELYRFFLMTVDPVHIGTGGYRLGRVDNTIVREPGTRVPKIPGTALHGAIRHYAAYRLGKPQCAGQSGHCGWETCPICYTFGAITENGARAGVVSISDAHILLFPVYSMYGPVWVTTPERLKESGLLEIPLKLTNDRAFWSNTLTSENSINLGWLMVARELNNKSLDLAVAINNTFIPEEIKKRIVVVSERLFTHIVNSNLEVRTSVSIDPKTGAAQEGALFTYEAIPRATVLWTDVVVSDFKGNFPGKERWRQEIKNLGLSEDLTECQNLPENIPGNEHPIEKVLRELGYTGNRPSSDSNEEQSSRYWKQVVQSCQQLKQIIANSSLNWEQPVDIIQMGFQWAEYLGIGGMGTRGFGRIKNRGCIRVSIDSASQPEDCKSSNKSRNNEQGAT